MNDVQKDFLGPPHGTTPAAIIANKNKADILKSSEQINEKRKSRNLKFCVMKTKEWSSVQPLFSHRQKTGFLVTLLYNSGAGSDMNPALPDTSMKLGRYVHKPELLEIFSLANQN